MYVCMYVHVYNVYVYMYVVYMHDNTCKYMYLIYVHYCLMFCLCVSEGNNSQGKVKLILYS